MSGLNPGWGVVGPSVFCCDMLTSVEVLRAAVAKDCVAQVERH